MKKISFKTLFVVGIVAIFSSCLGDSTSTSEFGKTYGYIKRADNGSLCAIVPQGFGVASETLNGLQEGRVYTMEAKVKMDQMATSVDGIAVFSAEKFELLGGGMALPEADPLIQRLDDIVVSDEVALGNVGVYMGYPQKEYTDDVWVFGFTCKVYESEYNMKNGNIRFLAYIDTKNQHQEVEEGEDPIELEKNQAIVKLFAQRENPEAVNTQEKKVNYTGEVSINMSELRRYFKNRLRESESQNEVEDCLVVFEFSGAEKSDGSFPEKPTRIGSFVPESRVLYGMYVER